MGVYNTFAYGSGITYGRSSALEYNVDPFVAIATSTTSASLTWATPGGDYLALRLLRNQQGYSEHYEDGVILLNELTPSTSSSLTDADGTQPLVSGKEAFYSIWVMLTDYSWILIGKTSCLLPRAHDEVAPDGTVLVKSASKFASVIPRTYLATGKTYLDEIDETSDLYHFLASMSLIVDEQHTLLENLMQDDFGASSNPSISLAEASQFGIVDLPEEAMLTAKRLVRQAVSNYTKKGTAAATQSFASALTGYGAEVSASHNLMLNMQDSTFYKAIGKWSLDASDATFDAVEDSVRQDMSPWTVDTSWVGEAVVNSGTADLTLGVSSPLLEGIPVTGGLSYWFTGSIKVDTDPADFEATIHWFDKKGVELSTTTGVSLTGTTADSWFHFYLTGDAPDVTYTVDDEIDTEAAAFAGITLSLGTAATYQLDMLSFAAGASDEPAPDYYEARAVEVYLYPSKINYVYNPSFEIDDAGAPVGWDIGAGSLSTETINGVNNGSNVALTTSAESRIYHEVPVGEYYVLSAYVRSDDASDVDIELTVSWDDDTITGSVTSDAVSVGEDWTRVSVRVYLPETLNPTLLATSATGGLIVSLTSTGDAAIDTVQFERGVAATDYFDGSMSMNGAFYSGDDPTTITSEEDVSYLYYNFDTKTNLLEATLPTQIPFNRAYIVTYGDRGVSEVAWGGTGGVTANRSLSLVALSAVTA